VWHLTGEDRSGPMYRAGMVSGTAYQAGMVSGTMYAVAERRHCTVSCC